MDGQPVCDTRVHQGIDVALCYNAERVKCLNCRAVFYDIERWADHHCPYALTVNEVK